MYNLAGPMPFVDVRVNVPDTEKTWSYLMEGKKVPFTNPGLKAKNIKVVQGIERQYGAIIQKWCGVLVLSPMVMTALIAAESGGILGAFNGKAGATGLCQVTPICAVDTVASWSKYNSVPMSSEAIRYLDSKVPGFTKLTKTPAGAMLDRVSTALRTDAEFNIILGTHYLRWLIQRYKGDLNKAYASYNAGPYGGPGARLFSMQSGLDSNALMPHIPTESKGYLIKILGKDGFFHLLVQAMRN